LKDPLPGAKIETAVGDGDDHGFAWRPMPLRVASAACPFFQDRGLP
jgi:hypothetical protein